MRNMGWLIGLALCTGQASLAEAFTEITREAAWVRRRGW